MAISLAMEKAPSSFLPIDSFPTDRFRPKGLKEIRAKPLVLANHRMAQPCDYL
jgi:hypothetical protein